MKIDEQLQKYLEWLANTHGDEVDFAVLYGSRARGQAKRHSDYDVLIGLKRDSDVRMLDRLLDYNWQQTPLVEAIPLGPSELDEMWLRYGRTLLDAALEGVALVGGPRWKIWSGKVEEAIAKGILERRDGTWMWHREREPAASGRMKLHAEMLASERARYAARSSP